MDPRTPPESTARDERERLYADMHADVGAKLLSLIYRATDPQQAELARSALQDLRDATRLAQRRRLPLKEVLADCRAESALKVDAAGCRLSWQQDESLPEFVLTPLQVLNLSRIMREAVSNAVLHAKPTELRVAVHYIDGQLQLAVVDDGESRNVAEWQEGRGLANMQRLAEELGSRIEWRGVEPKGSSVSCRIPLAA